MKSKKILSVLMAALLVVSTAAIAIAESADAPAAETVTADANETAAAEVSVDEMMTRAMADAYARQAAYAVYAEAYPDDRSITGVSLDTQIVLLEMLLKANGLPLPVSASDAAAPGTAADAYAAIAAAESDAVTMYRSFLSQESLPEDAKIIFRTVLQSVRGTASAFARKAQFALQAQQWQELMENGEAKVYTFDNAGGRGTWTVYVYSNTPTDEAIDTTDTTDGAAEDSVSD
jgi:hypothetical protein